jgi:2-keto-4-pentenoate hydratase/2-oxohepta-3-ene-1,7-dioic acid hydratase in catechol pathway
VGVADSYGQLEEEKLRTVRLRHQCQQYYGIVNNLDVCVIDNAPWAAFEYTGETVPLEGAELLAPVEPPNVYAIGLNYRAHAEEVGRELSAVPNVFIKANTSVIGPSEPIVLSASAADSVDYEAELAIVIGRACRNVTPEEAPDYIFGYTCGNDVSARDCQLNFGTQWARAKSFDTFCPLGPWIQTNLDTSRLAVSSRLNGQVMQQSDTSHLIFSCAELVSFISGFATLLPGTVIMTGTPDGVGYKRTPPVYLKAGDLIEIEVEGIGTLANRVHTAS